MRRSRALGIGLFLGMIACMFLGTTEPVLAARCIEECDSESAACATACQQECSGVPGGSWECNQVCHDMCGPLYDSCMQHSVYCSTQSYCYAWHMTWSCTSISGGGWWCDLDSKYCTSWT
jgi:hypothetical protein